MRLPPSSASGRPPRTLLASERCGPIVPSSSGAASGENRLRRALSYDETMATSSSPEKKPRAHNNEDGDYEMEEDKETMELGGRAVPTEAAAVNRGWRDCAARFWRAAEELRFRPAGVALVGALLLRCPALSRLVLHMERLGANLNKSKPS